MTDASTIGSVLFLIWPGVISLIAWGLAVIWLNQTDLTSPTNPKNDGTQPEQTYRKANSDHKP